jgi:hypothetical protein
MTELQMRDEQVEAITRNLRAVEEQIALAADRSGRAAAQVRIIVVSKAQSQERIAAAYAAGIRAFGENRVEEALPKIEALAELTNIEWHMIGHLQSRKAKLLGDSFALMHSVDRMKIARKLSDLGAQRANRLSILLECNLSGEQSKWGWELSDPASWSSVLDEFAEIAAMEFLQVKGLMTMGPFSPDQDLIRKTFEKCRELRDFLAERLDAKLSELSMGMSDDFQIAVEQGATLVRIGTAILGPRA